MMKKWLLSLGFIVFGLVLGLAILEASVRVLDPRIFPRPKIWRYDSYLGWEHIPNSEATWIGRDFKVPIRINSKGLRDREYDYAKAEGTFRILAFGDSFIEGWGIQLEEIVTERLEKKLNLHSKGINYEVINCGVAGYGTDQELLFLRREGVKYSPDLVILFFYVNDMWNNVTKRGIGSEKGNKPYFVLWNGQLILRGVPVPKSTFWTEDPFRPRSLRERLDSFLWDHSHLYNLLMDKVTAKRLRPMSIRYYEWLYSPVYSPRVKRAWGLTGTLIETVSEVSEGMEAKTVVVLVPAKLQAKVKDWEKRKRELNLDGDYDLFKPNHFIVDFCRKNNIPVLDLLPEFRRHTEAGEKLYNPHDNHWNPDGHKLAAELIYDYLVRSELISLSGT